MSFRIVRPEEQSALLHFLSHEADINLFIIGDIEFYGLSTDFQTVFVDDTPDYETVVLRYYRNLVVYSTTHRYPREEINEIMDRYQINYVNCGIATLEYLRPAIEHRVTIRSTTFARLLDDTALDPLTLPIRRATVDDAQAVVTALWQIAEFHRPDDSLEQRIEHVQKKYRDGFSVAYILERDGQVVAHAEASAQTSHSAMIVGVFTLPQYRQLGYASQVVSALCRHLLKEGKRPLLFFDNPSAAQIYHRLGFVDFSTWIMMPVQEENV